MIICLSHYKGGVGKTTLAINLAIDLGAPIMDLDGQQSSVMFNELRKLKNHTPIECYTAETETEMKSIFRDFAGDSKKSLIVDSGGYDSDINRYAMMASDMLITPLAPSQIELLALQKYTVILKQISEKYGQPFKTNVLINNADVRSKSSVNQLKQFIKNNATYLDLLETVIHSRTDYKRAYGEGLAVSEMDCHSKAADEIQQLVTEIKKDF
ncbi:MAG: plasmid partitioning protein [Firmicutes bacterium]|nr:plasmid partitioning protein [Bacillota bacterium]